MSISAPEKPKSSGMTPPQPSAPTHEPHTSHKRHHKHHGHHGRRWYHLRREHGIAAAIIGLVAAIISSLQTILNGFHWLLGILPHLK